jgi:hypothetical protein
MTYSVELIDPRARKLLEDLAALRLIRVTETIDKTASDEAEDDDFCRKLWDECANDPADEVVPLKDLASRLGVVLR